MALPMLVFAGQVSVLLAATEQTCWEL